MPRRPRHSKKEVEAALQYAEAYGCRVEVRSGGHAWGRIYPPGAVRPALVWSTPKNPGNHAKDLRRYVEHHTNEEG